MAETHTLAAEAREKGSKGAVRSLRRQGRVPAVIYGEKKTPELIHVSYKEINALYQTGTFMSHVLDVEIGGKKERVIPRDVQFEPVRDFIIHVDFLRLGKNATIVVNVPVHFHNHDASPGIKGGGVLNIVRHELELSCPADAIPEQIDIDLKGYEMGDSIHISAVTLPAKVTPTITDRDFTIATIAAPAAVVSADNEAKAEDKAEGDSEEAGEAGSSEKED